MGDGSINLTNIFCGSESRQVCLSHVERSTSQKFKNWQDIARFSLYEYILLVWYDPVWTASSWQWKEEIWNEFACLERFSLFMASTPRFFLRYPSSPRWSKNYYYNHTIDKWCLLYNDAIHMLSLCWHYKAAPTLSYVRKTYLRSQIFNNWSGFLNDYTLWLFIVELNLFFPEWIKILH